MTRPEEKNFYELLGISPNATEEEVRASYRELARIYHPDSNFYDEIIQSSLSERDALLFKRINEAYNTLLDSARRTTYDAELHKSRISAHEAHNSAVMRAADPFGKAGRPSDLFARPSQSFQMGEIKTSGRFENFGPRRSRFEQAMFFFGFGLPVLTVVAAIVYMLMFGQ